MKIVEGYPPNIYVIRETLNPPANVLFCYGDTIYNPGGIEVTPSLIAHETVHSERQGDQPGPWWHAYLRDSRHRMKEEILAHMAEYTEILSTNPNRAARRRHLSHIAHRLAGPLYGRLISLSEAKAAVKDGMMPASLFRDELAALNEG